MPDERIPIPVSFQTPDPSKIPPAEKVKSFPMTPGVYLMKDGAGNDIGAWCAPPLNEICE